MHWKKKRKTKNTTFVDGKERKEASNGHVNKIGGQRNGGVGVDKMDWIGLDELNRPLPCVVERSKAT